MRVRASVGAASGRPRPGSDCTVGRMDEPGRAAAAHPFPGGSVTVDGADRPAWRRPDRRGWWLPILLAAAVISVPLAIGLGPVPVRPGTVVRVIWHQLTGLGPADWTAAHENIVWLIRAPRVLLGALVGAALAVSGTVLQALTRNVLADPYLLGITSGASTGAAAAILFGAGASLGAAALTGSAFVGALAAVLLVFALARAGGRFVVARLVFAGIAVGFALGAVTNILIFLSDSRDGIRAVMFWLLGSLARADWWSIPVPVVVTAISFATLQLWSRRLDAMAIGDETARTLGTDPTRFRGICVAVAALAVAAAVAVSGMIGFVGLVVPHMARRLVGARHARVLPVAACLGAVLLVWADVVARTAAAPREIPLGILTALLGTPLLIALVRRTRSL